MGRIGKGDLGDLDSTMSLTTVANYKRRSWGLLGHPSSRDSRLARLDGAGLSGKY